MLNTSGNCFYLERSPPFVPRPAGHSWALLWLSINIWTWFLVTARSSERSRANKSAKTHQPSQSKIGIFSTPCLRLYFNASNRFPSCYLTVSLRDYVSNVSLFVLSPRENQARKKDLRSRPFAWRECGVLDSWRAASLSCTYVDYLHGSAQLIAVPCFTHTHTHTHTHTR